MNATQQAHQAYQPAQPALRTPRAIETSLFTEITSRLRRAGGNFPALATAILDNRMLWNTLAIDVADKENDLPDQLRASIFYLAQFTNHHSSKVLQRQADATALIDVNLAVIRGLNAQGKG